MLQRLFLPGILRKATRVMTNSQHTTQDVVRLFPGTQNKVTTNYLGVESFALPATSQDILEQYGIMQPYVLSVATIEPRKNLDLLLDMYTRFRRQIEDPVQLVIAGKRGWKYASFFRALETHPRQGHSMVQYHFRRIAIRIRCRFTRRNGCIHVFVMVERNINSESVPHWI